MGFIFTPGSCFNDPGFTVLVAAIAGIATGVLVQAELALPLGFLHLTEVLHTHAIDCLDYGATFPHQPPTEMANSLGRLVFANQHPE
jgi:hypothetical protein